MGTLLYAGTAVEFDDRLLTHLQIVIVQKFRRGESFLMSWLNDASSSDSRGSIWLTPAVPVLFTFDGSRVPAVDQSWIDRLGASADGPRGLVVTDAAGLPLRVSSPGHRSRPQTAPVEWVKAGR